MLLRGLFQRILFVVNIIALLGLGLSYLALFISPEDFWMPAFFGLAYPVLLIINILFFCFWLIFRWKLALFSGILIAVGAVKMGDLFQWRQSPGIKQMSTWAEQDSTLKVLSFNVRLFDLYNWTSNKLTRNAIMDMLQRENADILCFQEFFYEDTGVFNTLDTLLELQPARYFHIEHSAHVKGVNHWGMATFSRFPIVGKGQIRFRDSTDNISMYTDISAYGDTFRVYNLHLESIRFRREDYKTLKTITGDDDRSAGLEGPQRIISRMRRAFIRRARQTDVIRRHILLSPHPVIVCGDFNDTPASYTYHQISQGLHDAFRKSGTGMGTTYVGMVPFIRIDYILYSPEELRPEYFQVIRKKLSDHYPVVSVLKYLGRPRPTLPVVK